MRLFLLACFILLESSAILAQSFGDPEISSEIKQTKQFMRIADRASIRQHDGALGCEKKWNVWHELQRNEQGSSRMTPWQNLGPDTVSGRIISIDFHPTNPDEFLVGSASGGLWRTEDYGQSWECLTDEFFTMGVGAVAYNPQNPETVLIATGEGYGFGGEFTPGYGILISYDGGTTWNTTEVEALLSFNFAGTDALWHPVDSNKVCVATSFGVYYSGDGGQTYEYVLERIGGRMVAHPEDSNILFFAARHYTDEFPGGLWKSNDAGQTWEEFGQGLPDPNDFGFASIVIHPLYTDMMWVSVAQTQSQGSGQLQGLFKSTDGGQTFSEVVPDIDYFCYHPPYDNICQGWFANTLLVDPLDTNIMYGGGTRLWKSTDGGSTWLDSDLDSLSYAVHPDHHQTLFHPLTGDLFDCNDGGVNYSSDGGESWTNVSNGLVTHQFYTIASAKTDEDVVIGGTQDVGTFSTTTASEGGWNNDFSGDAFGHAIDHTDASIWYGTNFLNFQRIKTTDSGGEWALINEGTSGADQWRMPVVMHPLDNEMLFSSNNNFMYKSTNGGQSWSQVSSYGSIGTFVFSEDPFVMYANQLNGSTIYQSDDVGETWSPLTVQMPGSVTDLATHPTEVGYLYATIGSYADDNQLWFSWNWGESWQNITNGLPPVPAHTIAINPSNGDEIYVGTEIGVWVSENGGLSWEQYNEGLPAAVVVEDMHIHEASGTLRIGTYGRGYWVTDVITDIITELVSEEENSMVLFPNPANDVVSISFDRPLNSARLELMDVQGRLVLSRNFFGSQLTWDVSSIPQGSYLIRIIDTQNTLSQQLRISR